MILFLYYVNWAISIKKVRIYITENKNLNFQSRKLIKYESLLKKLFMLFLFFVDTAASHKEGNKKILSNLGFNFS